jgi:hypothetical protein
MQTIEITQNITLVIKDDRAFIEDSLTGNITPVGNIKEFKKKLSVIH